MRSSNDLTGISVYSVDAVDSIESTFRDVLATRDVLVTSLGDTTFLVADSGNRVCTPFEQSAGTLTVTFNEVDTTSSHHEKNNEVVSDSTSYPVEGYFVIIIKKRGYVKDN